MTTTYSDVISELSETILRCDICQESFDLQTRPPRLLSCFHAYCGACVRNLSKESVLLCPRCRRATSVQGLLPLDVTRTLVMDTRRASQGHEGVACEGCSEGAKATSRCQDCAQFLCAECSSAHRKMKVFKDHVVAALTRTQPDPLATVAMEKCDRHSSEKLRLFCVPCAKMACGKCAASEHKACGGVVELASILEEKKIEMLSLCGQLDKMRQGFQKMAEESEACIQTVDANLDMAVQEVEDVFSEIISSASERREEIVSELRTKARSDRLTLQEQAANFRSLQAAAQTASDYGRRVVCLNIVSQVIGRNPEIQKAIAEFSEMSSTPVNPAPTYKVTTEKLDVLKKLIREFGDVGSSADNNGFHDLPLTLTSFQLDASRCGAGCWVGEERCSLSNQPTALSRPVPKAQAFRFAGTCGTVPMSGPASYWQVRCLATPKTKIKGGYWLCAVGVATMQALQDCPGGDRWISSSSHSALAVRLYMGSGHVRAQAMYRDRSLIDTTLAASQPHSPVDQTLGLLLDASSSCLHVIDVTSTRVLCSSGIDPTGPLWPVVRVWPEEFNGAIVHLEVQTGQDTELTKDVARLLETLLEKEPSCPD